MRTYTVSHTHAHTYTASRKTAQDFSDFPPMYAVNREMQAELTPGTEASPEKPQTPAQLTWESPPAHGHTRPTH